MDEIKEKQIYYSNVAKVEATSVNDIKIGFGIKKNPSAPVSNEDIDFWLLTSPQHLKSIVILLTEQLRLYENLFGEINLTPNQQAMEELKEKYKVVENK